MLITVPKPSPVVQPIGEGGCRRKCRIRKTPGFWYFGYCNLFWNELKNKVSLKQLRRGANLSKTKLTNQ